MQRTLLPAGDAYTHKVQTLLTQRLLTAAGLLVEGVAGVNDNVAGIQQRHQLIDHRIHWGAGLDHDQHSARRLQRLHQLLQRLSADKGAFSGVGVDQRISASDRAVVQSHRIAVASQVPGQICAHHSQAGHSNISAHVVRLPYAESVCAVSVLSCSVPS